MSKTPITFDENDKANILWYMFALPCIIILCAFHFLVCALLMVFVHPERKRYKVYEYYSRWGWGRRIDMPEDMTQQ
tara:strand:+ start:703 stop:930 length:228 start_codon:yes stop_codon:yes gene_type:complete